MIRGSSLCGGAQYCITGPLSGALNCHCSICRNAQGAAFRTRASVRAADFEFAQGEDLLTFTSAPQEPIEGSVVSAGRPY
jgi:hypothetical protein